MKKKKTEMNYFTNEFRKSNTQKEARKLNKRYFQ